MALPAAFSAALAQPRVAGDVWFEVEGLPWAYGLTSRSASWFSGRVATQQRLGVAGALLGLPRGAEQEARPLDADSSIGEVSFQLQLDAAGTVLPLIGNSGRRDLQLQITADIDATSAVASIVTTGDASSFPSSGVLYVGRETFTYTAKAGNTFSGVTRGMYALPGLEAKQAHTAGDIATGYPRFLATRRVAWFMTLDGTDANRVTRWAGTLRGAKLMSGAAGVELTAESLEGDLKAKSFATQRTAKLAVGLTDAAGQYQPGADDEPVAQTTRLILADGSTSGAWTNGDQVLVRIGDEYIAGTIAVSGLEVSITVLGRGQFSSLIVQHGPGDELKEVIWSGPYSATGSAADQVSQFTAGGHPLEIVLQVLLSRKGDGANGTYDTLPEGWGAGLDASRVDVTGILALKRTWFPAARYRWVYEEPSTFKEMISDILRPHACYPVTTLGDKLTVRRLSPPIPGATLRTIAASGIVSVPSWDANIANVIGRVIWSCDYDPVSGDPRQVYKGELQGAGTEAQEFYAGLWRTLEVEARGQFSGNDTGVAYFGSGLETAAAEEAQRYFEMVRDRYARPAPLIGFECSFDYLDVEVGDLVALTVANLPDVTTGALGITGAICEVLRRSIDDLRGVVTMTLLQSTLPGIHRLLSPSGVVSSTVAGSITLVAYELTDADQDRTSGFYAGQVIQVRSSDLKTARGNATLTSVSATALSMATVPAGTVNGDVVLLDSYLLQPAIERLRHASLASTSELLPGGSSAHTYAT